MTMFSSNPSVDSKLLQNLISLLSKRREIKLSCACSILKCTSLDIPWGVNPPYFLEYRKDGCHWIVKR
jgi:hypothetical protein